MSAANSLNGSALNGHHPNGSVLNDAGTTQAAVTMDDPVSQHKRLTAEIEAATNRALAARARLAAREADVRTALQVEVSASRALIDDLERQHIAAIELVRDASQSEVARILAEARERAAGLQGPSSVASQGADGDR